MIVVSPQMLAWVLEERRADRLEAARAAHLAHAVPAAEALLDRINPRAQK